MKIGFVGLGSMGLPIARNLLKAGHGLTVYNRTRSRAEALRSEGARIANAPKEASAGAEVTISMVADDAALEQVAFAPDGVLAGLSQGATHVSMSTISVAMARRLTEAHAGRGQSYVSAPVFGRPQAAEAAQLFIVAAGPHVALRKCSPLFEAVGQKTFAVGREPMAANLVKLSGNFLITCVIESLGEAVALVRKYGISPGEFINVLTSSLFAAPIYRTYGAIIAEEKYEPAGFRLQLGLKDIRLAQSAAEAVAVPMPFASMIRDKFVAAVANGMADQDWSVLARMSAQQAGLS